MENGELQGCRTPSFDEVKYAVSNRRPIRAQHSPRNGHLICIAPRKNMTVQASLGLGHHPRLRVEALERRPGQGQPVGVHAHRCLIGAVNGSSTKVGDSERSERLPTSHSRQSANFHLEKTPRKTFAYVPIVCRLSTRGTPSVMDPLPRASRWPWLDPSEARHLQVHY